MIYLTATEGPEGVLGYEIIDGTAYPVMPQDSKMYRHDLELYGGKANVIANEFTRWFEGLWHGRSLAFVTAGFTVITSLGLFIVARHRLTVSKTFRGGIDREPQ